VVNEPTTAIIINLVIGLALTAAAVLLSPKPEIQDQKERKKVRQEQLPNDVGPSRFNQTSSFDGYASLVDYGIPVPIPFGKMGTAGDGSRSGGLVLAASLVWSRAFSYGTYQRAQLLYTLGEHILPVPQLRGVWLGTQSLSALGLSEYALYWKSQSGENRIKRANLISGTQGGPETGNPEPNNGFPVPDDVFLAPIEGAVNGAGFCMVNNPNSKAVFGQFNPVRNGTAHRLNWEVISIPFDPLRLEENRDDDGFDNDAVRRARAERIKNGGEFGGVIGLNDAPDDAGQPGVGRAYGTQMGVVAYAPPGQGFIESADKIPYLDVVPEQLDGNRQPISESGTRIKFWINDGNWDGFDEDDYEWAQIGDPEDYGVNHKDLTSAMDNRRQRADDLMQIGSKWMIGQTQWVVYYRTPGVWRPEPGRTVEVWLKCVSTIGDPTFGISGSRAATEPKGGYEGPWVQRLIGEPRPPWITPEGYNERKHCGAAFWNLVQYEVATARMTRPCDTIEFGIKSVVWNQANGLCRFNAIPTPTQLFQKDKDNISINTPTLSRYFARTSCFSVFVRPIPRFRDIEEEQPSWDRINQVFCVTGDSPREMYNYMRIRPRNAFYPDGEPILYEFRFIPRVGSDIAITSLENALFWQLSAGGEFFGQDFDTDYGAFRVSITGAKVNRQVILANEELLTDPADIQRRPSTDVTVPTAIQDYAWSTAPFGSDRWIKNAWLTHFLGNPHTNTVGTQKTATYRHFKPRSSGNPADDGWINVRITATVNDMAGDLHQAYFGTRKNWAGNGAFYNFTVVRDGTEGQWSNGDEFTITAPIDSWNPYSILGYTSVSAAFRVTDVTTETIEGTIDISDGERAFELNSQVSDCSHFDEITKSCDTGPEHEIVYINSAVSEDTGEGNGEGIPQYDDLTMMGLSIKSGPAIGAIEQPRVWVNGGIGVDRLEAGVFGISNLLSDLIYYLLTNEKQGLGEIIPPELVDRESLAATSRFLLENKIYWNGVVESDQNFRSFATDQAGRSLCIFTIKNGVFGMMPALPLTSSNAISTEPVQVDGIFTAGNIIDDSFKLSFASAEERRETALQVRWRYTATYELPEERTFVIKFAGTTPETIEDYDLSDFCDNRYQALMTARFALASRQFVDHTVEFQTTPEALGVQPGSYIKVMTEETEFQTGLAIKINNDMTITSPTPVKDGFYTLTAYLPGAEDTAEASTQITDGIVENQELRGAIASIYNTTPNERVYQISELTLGEDGLVSITASFVPTQDNGTSKVAYYTMTPNEFEVTY